MAKAQPIRKHSDKNFIKGFLRYAIIENTILNSDSWGTFLEKLEKKNKPLTKKLWQEYQLKNYVILIEQQLAELYNSVAQKGLFKNEHKVKNMLLKKIKRFRKLKNNNQAEKLLLKKVGNNEKRFYTPFVFFNIADFSLGDFVYFLDGHTQIKEVQALIEDLRKLNQCRNIVIHQLLSSRINLDKRIKDGLKFAKEILAKLEKINI